MYLIERRPGREELYLSNAELAAAIDRGEVDSESRIFHRARSVWISVTLHPLFRSKTVERPRELLSTLPQKNWTFLPVEAPSEARTELAAGLSPEAPAAEPGDPARSQPRGGVGPFRGLRRILHG